MCLVFYFTMSVVDQSVWWLTSVASSQFFLMFPFENSIYELSRMLFHASLFCSSLLRIRFRKEDGLGVMHLKSAFE